MQGKLALCSKSKELIPRQMFRVPIQVRLLYLQPLTAEAAALHTAGTECRCSNTVQGAYPGEAAATDCRGSSTHVQIA
jgi:hypothetical protein